MADEVLPPYHYSRYTPPTRDNSLTLRPINTTIRSLSITVVILFLVTAAGFAQTITTGDITGVVKDVSGAVVPAATISLKSTDTGESRETKSNSSGEYRFTTLRPGHYEISSKSAGLQSDFGAVLISIGQVANVDLVLKPEASKQIVMVTDAVPNIQTDNANQSTTLTAKQILDLPLPGGDTTTVAFTAPGVVVSNGAGYGNFSAHGLPGTSNLFTTNGNDNMDPYLNLNNSGASNLSLGANEISEVAVVESGYSVSYGRNAGAQVNVVTKSGTNQFHGNMLWNWNGSYLNANDFFNNASGTPKGRANSNQYGASIGGPIFKNKTFFFADTEGIRYILPSASIVSVPTVDMENYVLSQAPASAQALYSKAFALYNSAPGINRAVDVTNGDGPLQDSNGALGCGALAGVAYGAKTLGVDTPCARAFGTNVTNQNKEWLMSFRVDHQITNSQRIFFRFKDDQGLQPTATDPINSQFNAVSNQPAYEGQIDYTYVITPTIVNHLILSSSYYSALFTPSNLASSLSTFPSYFMFGEGGANGTGSFTSLGLNTGSYPQGRNVGQGQLVDDFSVNKGNHSLKFGVNYRKNRVSDHGPSALSEAGGEYYFNTLDDFAAGTIISPDYYSQKFASFNVAHIRLYNIGIYAQDEWDIRPNLKLTLGIRFDRNGNPTCVDKCFARLNSAFTNLTKGASVPYNQSITTGLSQEFPNLEPLVYQPRIGFVWDPADNKKTVIRGGVGLFSDQPPGTLAGSVFNNSPNIYTPAVRVGTVGLATSAGTASSFAAAANAALRAGFASGLTLAQINASLPSGITFTPPAYFSVPNKVLNPKYLEFSFEVQQALSTKDVITLSYNGNHGYNLFLENQMLNTYNSRGLAALKGVIPNTAPDPRFRIITNLQNDGVSNYNGLTAQYRRSLAAGFQMQVNYTWSHALDDVSNNGLREAFSFNPGQSLTTQPYPYNKSLSYSNADYDVRHSLSGDFTWDLPFKSQHHLLNGIIGGWSATGKIFAHTGTPFSVYIQSGASYFSSSTGGTVLAYATAPITSNTCSSSAVDTPCLTASQFTFKGFGNYPRNSFYGPDYFDIDYSAFKNFTVKEHYRISVGASFYNLLNHPNFSTPNAALNTSGSPLSGFGQIQSTVSAPTSAYGSFQGSAVSGRVIVTTVRFAF